MRPISLVECDPEHAAIVAALHEAALGGAWSPESVARLLRLPGSIGLIAADPDTAEPLGFVLCLAAGDALDIAALATSPPARRAGIARRLLAETLIRAQAAGFERIVLEVAERNAPALALYRAFGFAALSRRTRYYSASAADPGGDALVLEKRLEAGLAPRAREQ